MSTQPEPVRLVAIEEAEYVAFFQPEDHFDPADASLDVEVKIYEYNDLWDIILQDYYQGLQVVYFLDREQNVITDLKVTLF